MIILDILFKICMAPFSKYEDKVRLIAIVWLTPILAFVLLGVLNVTAYWVRPLVDIRFITGNTFVVAIVMALIVIFSLQKIYLKTERPLGKNFRPIVGLLIPVLIVGSLVLYVMSFKYT